MAVAPGVCSPLPAMTLASSPDLMSEQPADANAGPDSAATDSLAPESAGNESASALPSATTGDVPAFGWSSYAERVNGRFAMVGFVAVLLIEALSRDTFLHWAGLVP